MLGHRFAELLATSESSPADEAAGSQAFQPCPLVAFAAAPTQAAFIQEVYRLAAERTREQLQPRRPFRLPQFSRN